ncbi:MAG: hypothetical protein ACUVQZ_06225 [Candidatus Caldatribacteriaceae bacterium]
MIKKKLLVVGIIALFITVGIIGASSFAQEILPGIPRNEVIIIEDPSGRSLNPGRFNLWGGNVSS